MKPNFEIWTMEGCPTCGEIGVDLRKHGNVSFADLAELKEHREGISRKDKVALDVLTQLSIQHGKAPVVVMDGEVLTEGEVEKARKGEL